MEDKDKG